MYGESDAQRMGLPALTKRLKATLFDPQDRPLCEHEIWGEHLLTPPRDVVAIVVKGHGVLLLSTPDSDPLVVNASLLLNEEIHPIVKEPDGR